MYAWTPVELEDIALQRSIKRLLGEKIPELTEREKNLMASFAVQDYKNYLKVEMDLVGLEDSDSWTREALKLKLGDYVSFIRELSEWLDLWIAKWRQRVKIVTRGGEEFEARRKMDEIVDRIWRKLKKRGEILDFVVGSLVRSGELCLTNTLAESVVKGELYRYARYAGDPDRVLEILDKNPLMLLRDSLKAVKRLKNTKGHLVSIRIDESLWRERKRIYYHYF